MKSIKADMQPMPHTPSDDADSPRNSTSMHEREEAEAKAHGRGAVKAIHAGPSAKDSPGDTSDDQTGLPTSVDQLPENPLELKRAFEDSGLDAANLMRWRLPNRGQALRPHTQKIYTITCEFPISQAATLSESESLPDKTGLVFQNVAGHFLGETSLQRQPGVIIPVEDRFPYVCRAHEACYSNAPMYSWISIPSLETGAITWTMSTALDLETLDDRRGMRFTPAYTRLQEARSSNEALRISIVPTSNDGPKQIAFLIGSSLSDGRNQVNEEIRKNG